MIKLDLVNLIVVWLLAIGFGYYAVGVRTPPLTVADSKPGSYIAFDARFVNRKRGIATPPKTV